MKRILFNGYYGFQNTGDDAFVEVSTWGANEYWRINECLFLSRNLPKTEYPAKHLSKPIFKGSNRLETFYLATQSSHFISAGGSTFNQHIKYSSRDLSLISRNIFNKKLKIGAIGVSIGPFKNSYNEKEVVKYLKKIDFISVRDSASYNYLNSLELKYKPIKAFDLAALLPKIYSETSILLSTKSKKIVGISICNYESYVNGDLIKETQRNNYILDLLKKLPNDPNIIYRFFIFNGNKNYGDEDLTRNMASKLTEKTVEIIPYLNNVKSSWRKIEECDVMISTRLHASIFACYSNVPFFLFEYHRKCTDFLDDVGQSEKYRIFDGEIDIDIVVNNIEEILLSNLIEKPKFVEKTMLLAERNFTHTFTDI